MEIWKTIEEAPECEVSNLGNVRIKSRTITTTDGRVVTYSPHLVTPKISKCGYAEVNLPIGVKQRIYRLVHRLVLKTFSPVNNMDNLEVNHKDENKLNNNLENLEWVTSMENCNYGARNQKVSKYGLRYEIYCPELDKIFYSQKEAAEYIGVNPGTMSEYISGKKHPRNKYHWIRIGGYNYND